MRDLHAIVTGGRSGIGAACVEVLLERGARVSVLDLVDAGSRKDHCQQIFCNVADTASIKSAIDAAVEGFGAPDILINSAGVTQVPLPTVDVLDDAWDKVIDINLRGTFMVCREVGRHMVPRGRGAIVNIASVTGMGGFPGRTAYGPSKAGVINLTETLAVEWGKLGVRVNAVSPGYVGTDMVQKMIDGGAFTPDAVIARIPVGRFAKPREIASAILYLASDEASYITGAILPVDGGWIANRAP